MANPGKKLVFLEQNLDDLVLSTSANPANGSVPGLDADNNFESKNTMQDIIRKLHSELDKEHETNNSLRRKLNTLERERMEQVGKANDEILKLNSEVTRQRSEIERGEASRYSSELEIARLKREIGQEKRAATEREAARQELQDSFKQRVHEQSLQLEKCNERLHNMQREYQEEVNILKEKLEQKEKHIIQLCSAQETLESARQSLEITIQQKEGTLLDYQEQIQKLKNERHDLGETVRNQANNIELMKERQEQLFVDLGTAKVKVRSLEEAIEAERAAHLETKFGVEILQLRLRELEGSLQQEKIAKLEAENNRDKLNSKLTEMQKALDEALKLKSETYNDIKRSEGEFGLYKKQMLSELEGKQAVIKKLSDHMNAHQKDFAELKRELAKAQKHQISLEEVYNSSVQELQFLHQTFQADEEKKKGQVASSKKEVPKSSRSHGHLIEGLKQILINSKRKQDQLTSDIHKSQAQIETLTSELNTLKKTSTSKNKDFETCQKELSKVNKEYAKTKAELEDVQTGLCKLQKELQATREALNSERQKTLKLAERTDETAEDFQRSNQMTMDFLLGLYQQLATSQRRSSLSNLTSCATTNDLFRLIREQVNSLITTTQELDTRVCQLDSELKGKQELIQELQSVQEEEIGRLYGISEGNNEQWRQQKEELEKQYKQMIVDYQHAQKKLQSLADQAWDKLRVSSSLQQGLEAECIQQRQQLASAQRDIQSLLAAYALLASLFHPLCERYVALGRQRHLQSIRLERHAQFRDQVADVVESLAADRGLDGVEKLKKKRHPLLVFRTGAICVIAANRLQALRARSCQLYVLDDPLPGICRIPVYCGDTGGEFTPKTHAKSAMDWLTSANLMTKTLAVTSELSTVLDNVKKGEVADGQALTVSKKCLYKMAYQLQGTFPALPSDAADHNKHRASLCSLLRRGLMSVLRGYAAKNEFVPQKDLPTLTMQLQEQLLALTERLHTAEKERRDVRVELTKLRQEKEAWAATASTVAQLKQEMESLRGQIERQRSDAESRTEKEINSHVSKLKDENAQLQSELERKQQAVADGARELAELKNSVKRHEQHVRQLNKQLVQMEQERKQLKQNVGDAETALNTAARDKELIVTYVKTIESLLIALSSGPMPGNINQVQAADHLPTSKPSTELKACQHLVETFVLTQKPLVAKISCLQEEIELEKKHSQKLKQELTDICHRDYDDGDLNSSTSNLSNGGFSSSSKVVAGGDFVPLIPDSQLDASSFCSPKKQAVLGQ
jgi:chromosome segregation ATPase